MITANEPTALNTRTKRRALYALPAFCVVALTAAWGLRSSLWKRTPPKFGEVDPGVLYRSGQPTGSQTQRVLDRYGVRVVVNLRRPEKVASDPRAVDERATVEAHEGARFLNVVGKEHPTPEILEQFFELVDDPAQRPVWIHCSAGKVRSGALVAAYRIARNGWTPERAVAEAAEYGLTPSHRDYAVFMGFMNEFAASVEAQPAVGGLVRKP